VTKTRIFYWRNFV